MTVISVIGVGLGEVLNSLKSIEDEDLQIQLQVFYEHKHNDDDDLEPLSVHQLFQELFQKVHNSSYNTLLQKCFSCNNPFTI